MRNEDGSIWQTRSREEAQRERDLAAEGCGYSGPFYSIKRKREKHSG